MTPEEIVNELQGVTLPEIPSNDEVVLEGLGRAMQVQLSPNQKKAINAYGNARVKKAMSNSIATRQQRFLASKVNELSLESKNRILSGQANFEEVEFYLKRKLNISAGTIQNLNESKDEKVVGIQNFNSDKLSDKHDIAISAIKLSYGFSDTANVQPDNIVYSNAVDAETAGSTPVTVPNGILHAEVEFLIGGKVVLTKTVKSFFRDSLSVSGTVEGNLDSYQLKRLLLVKKNQEIQVRLTASKNAIVTNNASNNHYIEVKFFGEAVAS